MNPLRSPFSAAQRLLLRTALALATLASPWTALAGNEPYLYGPIQQGEQLGRIAYALRPDKSRTGTWQMAAALYRNNPRAFIRDDIARLQPGRMLLVPSDREVRGIDPALAQKLAGNPARAAELLRASRLPPQAPATPAAVPAPETDAGAAPAPPIPAAPVGPGN